MLCCGCRLLGELFPDDADASLQYQVGASQHQHIIIASFALSVNSWLEHIMLRLQLDLGYVGKGLEKYLLLPCRYCL
jgi:hypothetical protein